MQHQASIDKPGTRAANKQKPSAARSKAARDNGAKSRGPKTEGGKQRSAENSTRHGMYARSIVLPSESQEDYDQLRDQYLAEFSPCGPAESHEVETLINAEWRIRRFRDMETEIIEVGMQSRRTREEGHLISYNYIVELNRNTSIQSVYQFEPRLQRDFDRALRRLLDLQKKRRNEPRAVAPEPDQIPLIEQPAPVQPAQSAYAARPAAPATTSVPSDIGYHQNVGVEPCPPPEAPVCLYTLTPHLESIAGLKTNSTNSIFTIERPLTTPGNIVSRKTATLPPTVLPLTASPLPTAMAAWR